MINSSFIHKYEKRDEYYTPKILVEAILPYIPTSATIWCPFDTENSEFVLAFKARGNKVIHSHLKDGLDFFKYEPQNYEYIVSNPPFTKKIKVLERLYSLNKPFAMLLPLPMLNYQEVGNFFLGKQLELLIVDKKVSYDGNTSSFNTSYFCSNVLPKGLLFCNLEHNNSNKFFTPSRMYADMC
jgi:hypothetical protein